MGVRLFDWRHADIVPFFSKVQGRDAPHDPAKALHKRHRGLKQMHSSSDVRAAVEDVGVDDGDGRRVCEVRAEDVSTSHEEEAPDASGGAR